MERKKLKKTSIHQFKKEQANFFETIDILNEPLFSPPLQGSSAEKFRE